MASLTAGLTGDKQNTRSMVERSSFRNYDHGPAGDYTKPVLYLQPSVRYCYRGSRTHERSKYWPYADNGITGVVPASQDRITLLYTVHTEYYSSDSLPGGRNSLSE